MFGTQCNFPNNNLYLCLNYEQLSTAFLVFRLNELYSRPTILFLTHSVFSDTLEGGEVGMAKKKWAVKTNLFRLILIYKTQAFIMKEPRR